MVRRYFDVLEEEIRKALTEVAEDRRTTSVEVLVQLIVAGVCERMAGQPTPPVEDIRRLVAGLFRPDFFTDDKGSDPLGALRILRRKMGA